jgi:hypothetical protein
MIGYWRQGAVLTIVAVTSNEGGREYEWIGNVPCTRSQSRPLCSSSEILPTLREWCHSESFGVGFAGSCVLRLEWATVPGRHRGGSGGD